MRERRERRVSGCRNNVNDPGGATRRRSLLLWGTACVSYSVGIVILSTIPSPAIELPPAIPHIDKVGHFGVYGLYALLLLEAWRRQRWPVRLRVVGSVGAYCVLYGLLMEVLQGVIRTRMRSAELADVLANTAGIVVFLAIRWRVGFGRDTVTCPEKWGDA